MPSPNAWISQTAALPVGVDAADPVAQERRLAAERIAAVYDATPFPLVGGVAYGVLITAVMWPTAPREALLAWFAWLLVSTATRLADHAARLRDPQRDQRAEYWTWRYVVQMVVYAGAYCAAPILFMPYSEGPLHLLLIGGAIGAAAVGVFTTYFHARVGFAFLAATLLPLAVDQGIHYGAAGLNLVVGFVIYAGALGVEVLRGSNRFGAALRLRDENAQIAEERRRALALAEHANTTKSRFLAAVSHELRTPLNGIVGMAELLRGATTENLHRQRLDVVLRSARHLQSVIGDLLDLSRIEFGHLALQDQSYDPRQAVRDVTDLLGPVANERGLGFRVELSPTLPPAVRGDASRLRQVLHNLIGNALKYTRRGEVAVTAEYGGGLLRVRVRDTGPGIAPEQIVRIFDAFAQGSDAGRGESGTGLGLTLSRQMARAMGGDVTCQSTVGMGSEFQVHVAAAVAELPPLPTLPEAPLPQLKGTVLVVEDNAVNALVAVAMLEQIGLQAEVADDGEAALHRLRERPWSLVLMDCLMPGLDGLETTRRWRQEEAQRSSLARLPVVALTANVAPGERERCLAAGMDDFVGKPFSPRELAEVLQRHLPAG